MLVTFLDEISAYAQPTPFIFGSVTELRSPKLSAEADISSKNRLKNGTHIWKDIIKFC